jgi:hypothetical protein
MDRRTGRQLDGTQSPADVARVMGRDDQRDLKGNPRLTACFIIPGVRRVASQGQLSSRKHPWSVDGRWNFW